MAIAIYEAVYSDKAARTPWTHLAPGGVGVGGVGLRMCHEHRIRCSD